MVIINCDMGEAFGLYKMGDDEGLMPHIDVANVAWDFMAPTSITCARPCALPNSMVSRLARIRLCPICRGSDAGR